jgi:hypothetical protein
MQFLKRKRSLPGLSVGKGLKGRILGILGVGGELRPQETLLLAGLHRVFTGKCPKGTSHVVSDIVKRFADMLVPSQIRFINLLIKGIVSRDEYFFQVCNNKWVLSEQELIIFVA